MKKANRQIVDTKCQKSWITYLSLHFPTADRKAEAGPSKQETIDLTASSGNKDNDATCTMDDEHSLNTPAECQPSHKRKGEEERTNMDEDMCEDRSMKREYYCIRKFVKLASYFALSYFSFLFFVPKSVRFYCIFLVFSSNSRPKGTKDESRAKQAGDHRPDRVIVERGLRHYVSVR